MAFAILGQNFEIKQQGLQHTHKGHRQAGHHDAGNAHQSGDSVHLSQGAGQPDQGAQLKKIAAQGGFKSIHNSPDKKHAAKHDQANTPKGDKLADVEKMIKQENEIIRQEMYAEIRKAGGAPGSFEKAAEKANLRRQTFLANTYGPGDTRVIPWDFVGKGEGHTDVGRGWEKSGLGFDIKG